MEFLPQFLREFAAQDLYLSAHHGQDGKQIGDFLFGNCEIVLVQHHQVGQLARFERAD